MFTRGDSQGQLVVCDNNRHYLLVLTREGSLVSRLSERGDSDGQILNAAGVVFNASGALIVADQSNANHVA